MRSDRIRGRGEEMKKEEKTESFESKLKRLEETAGLLEREDVSLEDALQLYEEGIHLHKECEKILESARLRIEKLSAGEEK